MPRASGEGQLCSSPEVMPYFSVPVACRVEAIFLTTGGSMVKKNRVLDHERITTERPMVVLNEEQARDGRLAQQVVAHPMETRKL